MSDRRSKRTSVWVLLAPWLLLLVATAAAGIYVAERFLIAPQRHLYLQLAEHKRELARLRAETLRLQAYVALLGVAERTARMEVLEQRRNKTGPPTTTMRFTEVDETGTPIGAAQEFALPGRDVYVDTLTIRFDAQFVEEGDPLSGHGLMLFRRVFTSAMRPEEGYILDRAGTTPEVYARGKPPSAFERNLWSRFWEMVGNEALARRAGVRAIHGTAPYTRVESGKVYNVTLRPNGEVSIRVGREVRGDRVPADRH